MKSVTSAKNKIRHLAMHEHKLVEKKHKAEGTTGPNPIPRMEFHVPGTIGSHVPMEANYADDLNFVISGPDPRLLRNYMQIVGRKVGGYLRSRLLTVAAPKNQAIVFQKSSNQAGPWMKLKKLRINGSIFE